MTHFFHLCLVFSARLAPKMHQNKIVSVVIQSLCRSRLGALCPLWLLSNSAVVLWLILEYGRLCLGKQRCSLQGAFLQEVLRCYQITVALGVWEGVAWPSTTSPQWAAGCRCRQRLFPHLIPHLESKNRTFLMCLLSKGTFTHSGQQVTIN